MFWTNVILITLVSLLGVIATLLAQYAYDDYKHILKYEPSSCARIVRYPASLHSMLYWYMDDKDVINVPGSILSRDEIIRSMFSELEYYGKGSYRVIAYFRDYDGCPHEARYVFTSHRKTLEYVLTLDSICHFAVGYESPTRGEVAWYMFYPKLATNLGYYGCFYSGPHTFEA